jgi:oligopeptide transport system permease protein
MQLERAEFTPAIRDKNVQKITRPSLSYWQDAWIRLRKNKQALTSLCMVIALLLFTLAGPILWRVDPSEQDHGSTSDGPSLGRVAIVADSSISYQEIELNDVPAAPSTTVVGSDLPAPESLELMEPPTTQGVRLKWSPVPGAAGYSIYRGDRKGQLGVPIGDVDAGNKVSYEDSFDLKAQKFYYSVVAKNGEESKNPTSIEVDVRKAISLDSAHLIHPEAKAGDSIKLSAHPFGTDQLGRDLLARLMAGARVSLFIGLVGPLLYVMLGILIGGIAGYAGGRVDNVLMRVTDFVLALPFLLFMILFRVASGTQAGESGITPMLISLIVLSWTGAARLVRGQVLQLRESEFVQAAKLLGARPKYILSRHLIPNTMGVILVYITFAIPGAIFTEAFLSFIGMGVVPPTPSWGSMCNDGIQTMLVHPHEFLFPAFFISVTVLAFNLLGDGLRDALDPKMRSRE